MKSTTVLLILVVLAVVLAIVAEARLTPEEKAAKKEARKAARKDRKKDKACRYNYREAKTAACDPATQMKTVSLKPGQPAECAPTKQIPCNKGANRCIYNWREATCVETAGKFEKTAQKVSGPAECAATKTKNVRRCGRKAGGRKGCKYKRGTWSSCDPVTNKKVLLKTLKRGDPESCDQTMTVEKLCKRKPKRNIGCKYKRGNWSACDLVTNKKVMVKTLKRGDPGSCNQTLTVQKVCEEKRKGNVVCKYKRTQWSDCDPVSNKKVMIKTLKSGKTSVCQPTQTIEKLCKRKKKDKKKKKERCKYKKNKWGPCDPRTNTVSRLLTLRKGNIGDCQATKTISRPCRKNKKRKSKRTKGGCRYDKTQWGPCNAATNTVTRTLTLKSGDPAVCNATKIDVRKCKDKHLRPHVCKYKRGRWSECNPVTNMKVMVKMLKRGDPAHCEASTTVERKCKRKSKTPGASKVCKYKSAEWSPCDIATNTMTRKQSLKSGPSTCQPVKEYSRKCKVPCKFTKGEWSECDPETNQMTRVDTVRSGSADYCGTTRVLTKKCNKKGKKCKYSFGEWGECDADTKKRTRVRTLISGPENCPKEKIVSKTCAKSNGEERCFFGPWGEYDECQNGVQKKKRQVLQGGIECERKGVKIKSC